MLKLNLASGQRPFGSGWTNCDIQERWYPHVICDMRGMPQFSDDSAEIIVIHQGLEHLLLHEATACLKECHRILAPGGSLLVFVPDIYALVTAWLSGKIDDYILMVNLYGAYMQDSADSHKWGWVPKTLAKHMKEAAPWREVKPFDWREILDANLARDWWVLSMEAVK